MIKEKSVGIIVFRRQPQDGVQYLVLYHGGSYWNFAKGHVEAGESELETGLRELAEETRIKDPKIIEGFRQQTSFFFRETHNGRNDLIKKELILYLGEVSAGTEPVISHEHNGYAWFDGKMAAKFLKFKNLKGILDEAEAIIAKQ